MPRTRPTRARMLMPLAALALLAGACTGDFDQRIEEATLVNPGSTSAGVLPNPQGSPLIRGAVSIGGGVRNAGVTLRRVNSDGTVNWNDAEAIGTGTTFDNGIYQIKLADNAYRGPIFIDVRARTGASSDGGNPATATTNRFHSMGPDHFLWALVPMYDGYTSDGNHVTPLTTAAIARGMSFDGSIAGVLGGVGAGMYGLICRQTAEFFAIPRVRASQPTDFAAAGSFGTDDVQAYLLAALSQLARDIGVANVWDFWLGVAYDAMDDGALNGSIGFIPNTGVAMPDLGQAGVLGTVLHDRFLDPNNAERVIKQDNTDIPAGGALDTLIVALDQLRDINNSTTREYDMTLRVPQSVTLAAGGSAQVRAISLDQVGDSTKFHPYGDSAGPSFVEYVWLSSSPGQVDVLPYGRIEVAPAAPNGDYTLTLTIQPAAGQSFVTGATEVHSILVRVR